MTRQPSHPPNEARNKLTHKQISTIYTSFFYLSVSVVYFVALLFACCCFECFVSRLRESGRVEVTDNKQKRNRRRRRETQRRRREQQSEYTAHTQHEQMQDTQESRKGMTCARACATVRSRLCWSLTVDCICLSLVSSHSDPVPLIRHVSCHPPPRSPGVLPHVRVMFVSSFGYFRLLHEC